MTPPHVLMHEALLHAVRSLARGMQDTARAACCFKPEATHVGMRAQSESRAEALLWVPVESCIWLAPTTLQCA